MEHVPQTTSNEAPSANHCGRHRSHTSFREVTVDWKASTKPLFTTGFSPTRRAVPSPHKQHRYIGQASSYCPKHYWTAPRPYQNNTQQLGCSKATRARTSRGHMRALNAQNVIPHFMYETFPIRTHNEHNYSLKPFGYLFWHSADG